MATDPQRFEAPPRGGKMTFEEYLELERARPDARYEYLNGIARLMAGGSKAHEDITLNIIFELRQNFRTGPCHVSGTDLKVLIGVKPNGRENRVFPDVTVSCDVADRRRDTTLVRSPRIVVEVLSPSTEATDRGEKLAAYKACPTIQEIVLVNQFAPHVEIHRRDSEDGATWSYAVYDPGSTVELRSVDVFLSMDEIYQGIDFNEPLREE